MKIYVEYAIKNIEINVMGRTKKGGYLIEWWIGDHLPRHIHVYENGSQIAKVELPGLRVLQGNMSKKLNKILRELLKEGIV